MVDAQGHEPANDQVACKVSVAQLAKVLLGVKSLAPSHRKLVLVNSVHVKL
jgi:hypothetical protein